MANAWALGNSSMGYLVGHIVVPICSPATTHLLRIKLTTPLYLLHLLMTTPCATASKWATSARTQNKNRPKGSIHTTKTMDGYNAPEVKPWQNGIHPLQLPAAAHKDITRTTQCPWWPYCSKCCSEISGRISGPTPNFKKHINEKAKKAMANIIKLCAICKYLTVQSYTTLVLMFCITYIDYSNAMLYGLPSSTLRKSQTIQNTKFILNKNRYLSSLWVLKKLHWLPIQQRIEHKILMTTFKCITDMAPKYLQDLMSIKSKTWVNMQPNNTGTMLHTPKVKYQTFTAQSFRYSTPTLMNQLPQFIKDSPTLDIFKKRLKTHLFWQAFSPN